MRTTLVGSTAIAVGIALGLATAAPAARAEEGSASEAASSRVSPAHQRLADATLKLENAFNEQFLAGKIDRSALAGPIDEVLQATPETIRPKASAHIDHVLAAGASLAARMTPEQRTAAVAAPAAESIGKTEQAQLVAFGYPGAIGWGGFGAFAFPATYASFGYGAYGMGYGAGYGAYGLGCAYGCGLGVGWGW
jgi:hypothetical protein